MKTFRIIINGVVQGVGFRPTVYRIAHSLKLKGCTENNPQGVKIILQSTRNQVDQFVRSLKDNKPPASKINKIDIQEIQTDIIYSGFDIIQSSNAGIQKTVLPVDMKICDDCVRELYDVSNRRYMYPLINCTNCGPRYTISQKIPYDRINTSMTDFKMCSDCQEEYKNPTDRRYHAEPISCSKCGPEFFIIKDNETQYDKFRVLFKITINFLKQNKIIALKGLGGYHLVCNAESDSAVSMLRQRKNRGNKPFAIMAKDIQSIKKICYVNEKEINILKSVTSPIVLLKRKANNILSNLISPGNRYIGVMLPYTPLHKLFFDRFEYLVMTSANLSNEPMIASDTKIKTTLGALTDLVFGFNRRIIHRCDDSIMGHIYNDIYIIIRHGRGLSPYVLNKNSEREFLCMGADKKNNFALVKKSNTILSQYMGDLEEYHSYKNYQNEIESLLEYYKCQPEFIVADLHPGYYSTRLAETFELPVIYVQHHKAHIFSVMFEKNISDDKKVLGIAFDGTGYGEDKQIWGGEIFYGQGLELKHIGNIDNINLIGGEKAVKEPVRLVIDYFYNRYKDNIYDLDYIINNKDRFSNLKQMVYTIKNAINYIPCHSMGRMFDFVGSLIGLGDKIQFEAELPMKIESLYNENIDSKYIFDINDLTDKSIMGFDSLVDEILSDLENKIDKSVIISKFLNAIPDIIYRIYSKINKKNEINIVILSGGVFQNKVILRKTYKMFTENNVPIFFNNDIPINDGGIGIGQAYYGNETCFFGNKYR